jgi:hypothetical protein
VKLGFRMGRSTAARPNLVDCCLLVPARDRGKGDEREVDPERRKETDSFIEQRPKNPERRDQGNTRKWKRKGKRKKEKKKVKKRKKDLGKDLDRVVCLKQTSFQNVLSIALVSMKVLYTLPPWNPRAYEPMFILNVAMARDPKHQNTMA